MAQCGNSMDRNIAEESMNIRCREAAENSFFESEKENFFNDGEMVKCKDMIFLCQKVTSNNLDIAIDQMKSVLSYNIWNHMLLSESILCEMKKRPEYYESFSDDFKGLFTVEEYNKIIDDMGKADAFVLKPTLYATALVLGCYFLVVIPENGELMPYTVGPEEAYNANRVIYIGFENGHFWYLYPCKGKSLQSCDISNRNLNNSKDNRNTPNYEENREKSDKSLATNDFSNETQSMIAEGDERITHKIQANLVTEDHIVVACQENIEKRNFQLTVDSQNDENKDVKMSVGKLTKGVITAKNTIEENDVSDVMQSTTETHWKTDFEKNLSSLKKMNMEESGNLTDHNRAIEIPEIGCREAGENSSIKSENGKFFNDGEQVKFEDKNKKTGVFLCRKVTGYNLWHATIDQLKRVLPSTNWNHVLLRKSIICELRKHPEYFMPFYKDQRLSTVEEYNKILDDMEITDAFMVKPVVHAAAVVLRYHFVIVIPVNGKLIPYIEGSEETYNAERRLYIGFEHGRYWSLHPRKEKSLQSFKTSKRNRSKSTIDFRENFFSDGEQVKCNEMIFRCQKVAKQNPCHAVVDQLNRVLPSNNWDHVLLRKSIICELRKRPEYYMKLYEDFELFSTAEKYNKILDNMEKTDAFVLKPVLHAAAVVLGYNFVIVIPVNGKLFPYIEGPEECYNAERVLYIGFESEKFWSLHPCKENPRSLVRSIRSMNNSRIRSIENFFIDGRQVKSKDKVFLCKAVIGGKIWHAAVDQLKRVLPSNNWNHVLLSKSIISDMRKRPKYYMALYEEQGLSTVEVYNKILDDMEKADVFVLKPLIHAAAVVLGYHFVIVIPMNEKFITYIEGPQETYNASRLLYIGFENERFWSLYPYKEKSLQSLETSKQNMNKSTVHFIGNFFNDGEQVKCEDKVFLCQRATEDNLWHAAVDQLKRVLRYNNWNHVSLRQKILREMRKHPEYYMALYEEPGLSTVEEYNKILDGMEKGGGFVFKPVFHATAVVLGYHFVIVIPVNGKLIAYVEGPGETYNANKVLYIGFENEQFWSLYPC